MFSNKTPYNCSKSAGQHANWITDICLYSSICGDNKHDWSKNNFILKRPIEAQIVQNLRTTSLGQNLLLLIKKSA